MEAKVFYEEITDWNLPFGQYPQFKGEQKYQIPISPVHFRRDGIDADVISDLNGYNAILTYLQFISFVTLVVTGNSIVQLEDKFDYA